MVGWSSIFSRLLKYEKIWILIFEKVCIEVKKKSVAAYLCEPPLCVWTKWFEKYFQNTYYLQTGAIISLNTNLDFSNFKKLHSSFVFEVELSLLLVCSVRHMDLFTFSQNSATRLKVNNTWKYKSKYFFKIGVDTKDVVRLLHIFTFFVLGPNYVKTK